MFVLEGWCESAAIVVWEAGCDIRTGINGVGWGCGVVVVAVVNVQLSTRICSFKVRALAK